MSIPALMKAINFICRNLLTTVSVFEYNVYSILLSISVMLPEILKNLGLTQQAVAIFLQLARLGTAPASRLATKTGIKRTTCYQILENLVKRGFIKRLMRSNIRYYKAASPSELYKITEDHLSPLQQAQRQLIEQQNMIKPFYQESGDQTEINFYEGFDEIKLAYDAILEEEDIEIYSIIRKQDTTGHPLSNYWKRYLRKRIEKNKTSYSLVPETEYSQKYRDADKIEKRNSIAIPEQEINIFGDIKVCGNIIAIISQHEGRIFGITIKDKRLADMQRGIMKTLWKHYSSKRYARD